MLIQIFTIKYFKSLMNTINTKLKLKNPKFLGLITVFIITMALSCNNESNSLGEQLLPETDKVIDLYDTLLTFNGNVSEGEPTNTSNLMYYSLGIINDATFGTFKGEYIFQFLPLVYDETLTAVNIIDSACLYIAIDSIYGNPKDNVTFKIYELTSGIDEGSSYLSNTEIDDFYNSSSIIGWADYSGDTLLKVRLSYSFSDKLLSDPEVYKDEESFLSAFKGLAIIPEASSTLGGVVFANLNSINTEMVLYYSDSLSITYLLPTGGGVDSRGQGFAEYSFDYSTSAANTYLTNSEGDNDDMLFVQGINGISTKITFSNIDSWFEEDSAYSILTAELIIPVKQDDNFDLFYPPERLYLEYRESDSSYSYIQDYEKFLSTSVNLFDGYYNADDSNYRFFISNHLNKVLNRDIEDLSLYLNIISNSFYPHRAILSSSEDIKLKVTYTKH